LLAHDRGVAVLLSSHLLHQVQQVCDRIAIFVGGSVAAMGSVADLARSQQAGALIQMEVGADGDSDAVESTLRSVPGVTDVRRDGHDVRIWVVTGESDIHEGVVRALIASNQIPWLLRNRGMSLDEIYQRYFGAPLEAQEAQNGGGAVG
jgi:ABC-2 type transport system ATP-binding protein